MYHSKGHAQCHYAPRKDLHYLDWSVEDALKVVVSGGVVQPGIS